MQQTEKIALTPNCFISSQSTHSKLIHVHLTGSKKTYLRKNGEKKYNILRADYIFSYIYSQSYTLTG